MRVPVSYAIALFATAGLMASCAPTSQGPHDQAGTQRQCFSPREVSNFRSDGSDIYLRARISDVYKVSAPGFCRDLDFANTMVIGPDLGVSERLCVGDSARITPVGGGAQPITCRVRIERRLTDEEIDALPSRLKP